MHSSKTRLSEHDRREVRRLRLQGATVGEIAEKLHRSRSQVAGALRRMDRESRASIDAPPREQRAALASEMDLVRQEAWKAWEMNPSDPRFLGIICLASERLAALLGIDAPKKSATFAAPATLEVVVQHAGGPLDGIAGKPHLFSEN